MKFGKNFHWQEEKNFLVEGKNILTEEEFSTRGKNILKISDKTGKNIGKILDKEKILEGNLEKKYSDFLKNYLSNGNSSEIINYFSKSSDLELIDFIENFIFKNKSKEIFNLTKEILNKIYSNKIKENYLISFLLNDYRYFYIDFLNQQRFLNNPKKFLKNFSTKKNISNLGENSFGIFNISNDYSAEFDDLGNPIKIGKVDGDIFNGEDYGNINKNKEINIFGNSKDFGKILSIIHTPKIRKFLEEMYLLRFENISLKSQINLFNYFIFLKTDDLDKYKRVIANNWDISDLIQNAFLAASENPKFAEIILNIADSKILSSSEKKLIFEKYGKISENIEKLSKKIFKHYQEILTEKNRETKISQNEIRKNFIEHAGDLFTKIFENLENGEINLEKIFDEFEKFDLETVGIFNLIEELNISEIEDLQLKGIPKLYSEKISHKEMKNEFKNNSDLSKQVKNILTEKFSEEDFNAFENDFLEDKSSEIFTLKNGKNILYIVGTRILDDKNNKGKKIKYIDWLANSPKLGGFNLKLTENFLKNELNLDKNFGENGEFFDKENSKIKKIEALGEPEILTSFLFVEKFGFIINGTSGTPESGKYGEEGKFFKLEKSFTNGGKKFLAKEKNLNELKILKNEGKIFLKEFFIPDDNKKILENVNNAKKEGYCISRFIQLEKIVKIEKDDKIGNKNNNKKSKNSQKRILCAFEKLKNSENIYPENFYKAA